MKNDINALNKVSIIYNNDVEQSFVIASNIKTLFEKENITAIITTSSNLDSNTDFAVTVGGDGTFLKAARFYAPLNVPILGINLGRLGFLAQANIDEIDSVVSKIINKQYRIEERMMLSANGTIALNDIVIKGDSFSRTSKLFLSINDKVVCDYLADGIIISTPTGSTAYTLSAGGPVVYPQLDAIIIVPICAHTLNARPLVIPANDKIKISSCQTCNKLKMSADGQSTTELENEDFVSITKSEHNAKLVILEKENNEFYSILREKLQWGVSPKR